MKALLLAAGLGTRLRPLTNSLPKCLVPVRGRPLLEYWLDLLFRADIESAVINTHYLPNAVRQFVAASPWRDRVTLFHEESLLGTGGTVLRASRFFEGKSFIVAHADNLTVFDVKAFVQRHLQRPADALITMMTFDSDAPESCGIVIQDERGIVTEFHEKSANPPGRRANAAVYIFEPDVISTIESIGRPFVDLSTEILPRYLGRICTWHNHEYHRDIGTPESLQKAEAEYPAK